MLPATSPWLFLLDGRNLSCAQDRKTEKTERMLNSNLTNDSLIRQGFHLSVKRKNVIRSLARFTFRSALLHTLTYFIVGSLSFWFITHSYDETTSGMRDIHGQFVAHWFLPGQIVRGILFGLVLFPLRDALLGMKHWGGFIVANILFTIGSIIGINGVIETWIYTTSFNSVLFLVHLPEVLIQSLLYGYLLLAWERRVIAQAH
jgi:hypothetical protein